MLGNGLPVHHPHYHPNPSDIQEVAQAAIRGKATPRGGESLIINAPVHNILGASAPVHSHDLGTSYILGLGPLENPDPLTHTYFQPGSTELRADEEVLSRSSGFTHSPGARSLLSTLPPRQTGKVPYSSE